MDTWSYNAQLGQEQQAIPVFAAGSYLGQIEEVGMSHTRRGDPKLAITLRVWTKHPTDPSAVSRTVNEHLVSQGHPTAVQLSAKRSVQLSESLGMQATGQLSVPGLAGQWVGVILSDKVETIRGRDGTNITTPVNRVQGYISAQSVAGPHDPSQPVIHPPIQRPAAPAAPANPPAPAAPAPAAPYPAGAPAAPGYPAAGWPAPALPAGVTGAEQVGAHGTMPAGLPPAPEGGAPVAPFNAHGTQPAPYAPDSGYHPGPESEQVQYT